MVRHDGHRVSQASVLRLLRDDGLILPAEYQRERRRLAQQRKAAFAATRRGRTGCGSWTAARRIAGCRDWFSKLEHPFHTSPTANQHDAIAAIELAQPTTRPCSSSR